MASKLEYEIHKWENGSLAELLKEEIETIKSSLNIFKNPGKEREWVC